jgi:hypothetical protein
MIFIYHLALPVILALPENLARMAASKFILDAAIQARFSGRDWIGWPHPILHWMWPSNSNLGSGPLSKSITNSIVGPAPKFKLDGHIQYQIGCNIQANFSGTVVNE